VTVSVPADGGILRFPTMSTDTLTIRFVKVVVRAGQIPAYGIKIALPVGLQSLSIPALGNVAAVAPSGSKAVNLPCGTGPAVSLDGRTIPTEVMGTVSDLESLRPMGMVLCGGPVSLSSGNHVIQANAPGGAFKVTALQAVPTSQPAPGATRSARTSTQGGRRHFTVESSPPSASTVGNRDGGYLRGRWA
jgi:arabinofuranan 3-O-arabinosyltransferase